MGQGSFGEVYRAFDTTLEREVALKLLSPQLGGERYDSKAVLKEARLLARVRHPNVVSVYGVETFDGRVGFWSDFVRGSTLSSLLVIQGRFGPNEAVLIGLDVCRAVNAIHAAGLLHRDIKTANVMREEGGRILLMDFGLSLERNEHHALGGTPSYMAPELFAGEPATVASDIYALGVLLYNLMTGKYPVDAPAVFALRAGPDSRPRRSLHDERTDLPGSLVHVIEKALEPDPKNRFATAGQMIAALSESVALTPAGAGSHPIEVERPARRAPLWLLGPAAAVLVLIGWLTPLRQMYDLGPARAIVGSTGHAEYLKAQNFLDRYYQPQSIEKAVESFRKTIDEDPRFALAHAGLCRTYFLQFRDREDPALIEKTQDACATALGLERDLASAHVTLGMLYTLTSRSDLAAQELGKATALDANNAEVYEALAELDNRQGRAKDVEPQFQKAVDLAPADWRWPNQLGYYHLTKGNIDEAVRYYRQAARLTSDNARVWNNLGVAYRRQSNFDEAEAAFRKAIAIDPRDNFLSNLGVVLEQEGRYPEAAELYQQSVALNPSNYPAYANLASVHGRIPGEEQKARETFLKAVALAEDLRRSQPKDATLLSRLGSYYATLGMSEQSLPLLRQAAALQPDDAQVLCRVGEGRGAIGSC